MVIDKSWITNKALQIYSVAKRIPRLYMDVLRNVLPIEEENYEIINVQGTARTFKANIKASLQSKGGILPSSLKNNDK